LRDEAEWRDVWKKYFKPHRVGRAFVVKPSWEPWERQAGDRVLEIDPGRAFGTGGHESTQLVMEAMEELAQVGTFLDVGTGSGILALAAASLWPSARGVAIDVDPEAVLCARENIERCGFGARVAASGTPIGKVQGTFDAVFANLAADTLEVMRADLALRV